MKTLIVLLIFTSISAFADSKKAGPDIGGMAAKAAAQSIAKSAPTPSATITKADAIKAIESASPSPSPAPAAPTISIVPFGSALQEGSKIYLTSYTSADGKEQINIKLDCSVDTNLKVVKTTFGYGAFKQYVKTHCPKSILPLEN